MIDRRKMIEMALEAEDGPGLRFSYGALLSECEDMKERQRSGEYREPELDQRLQAVRHLMAVEDKEILGRICMIISLLSEIQNEQSLRRIYELAEYLCTHEDEGGRNMEKKKYLKRIFRVLAGVNDAWVLKQIYRCVIHMVEDEDGGAV